MSKIALFYSTTDGHTLKICHYIQSVLSTTEQISIIPIAQAQERDLAADKIIIGASIRYGKHQKELYQFINRHLTLLQQKPAAFFSVSIVARKPNRQRPDNNPYFKRFLSKSPWQPKLIGIFAGKLEMPRYRYLDKIMIRLIMKIGKSPVNNQSCIEFTNWEHVHQFAEKLRQLEQ